MPISIRHSFADAESIVYSAHRGEDGRLLSPLHTNSPIDVKFRDLIPEFLAKYEVVPEEIGLGMLPNERFST